MSVRHSEYARMSNDLYVTPRWVFEALYSVETFDLPFDPAPKDADFDFLSLRHNSRKHMVTNPPFSLATEFCRHAIELTREVNGKVAMLLPHAFDAAKGRLDLWHLPFKAKYTLTRRIRWENLEQKKAGPSTNHAWFVWDWKYIGPPRMGWLPLREAG